MWSPFEMKLKALLAEALQTEPSHDVVGALIGAAIATTIQVGRDPRVELYKVLDTSLAIMFGKGQPPS